MLSGPCHSVHRLCKECDLEAVHAEYVPDYMLYLRLVVSCLHRRGVLPVDLELLHDVVEVAGVAHLGLYSAYLFVPHLDAEAVTVKYLERLLERGGNRSGDSLPVLLFQLLSYRELVSVRPVVRRLYPEFKLGGVCEQELIDIVGAVHAAYMLKHIRIVLESLAKSARESVDALLQVYP